MEEQKSKLFFKILPIIIFSLLVSFYVTRLIGMKSDFLLGEFPSTNNYLFFVKSLFFSWNDFFGAGFSNTFNSPGLLPFLNYGGAFFLLTFLVMAVFQAFNITLFGYVFLGLFFQYLAVYFLINYFNDNKFSRGHLLLMTLLVGSFIAINNYKAYVVNSAGSFAVFTGFFLFAVASYFYLKDTYFSRNNFDKKIMLILIFFSSLLFLPALYYFIIFLYFIILDFIFTLMTNKDFSKLIIFYLKIAVILVFSVFVVNAYFSVFALIYSEPAAMPSFSYPFPQVLQNIITLVDVGEVQKISSNLIWGYFILPTLAFLGGLANLVKKKNINQTLFFALLFIVFVFLAKGTAEPLSGVSQWLFERVPLLSFFRDTARFLVVIQLVYIFFLTSFFAFVMKIKHKNRKIVVSVFLVILISFSLYVTNPTFFSGDFGKRINNVVEPSEYKLFKKWAETNLNDGRVYYFSDSNQNLTTDFNWSPSKTSSIAPYALPFSSIFPVDVHFSNVNPYGRSNASQLFNFLIENYTNEPDFLAKVLAMSNTKYLVFDDNLKRTSKFYERYQKAKESVSKSKSFRKLKTPFNKIDLYINSENNSNSLFTISENNYLVSGDLRVYKFLHDQGINIKNDHLFFIDQQSQDVIKRFSNNHLPYQTIYFNTNQTDLIASLNKNHEINSTDTKFNNNNTKQWVPQVDVYKLDLVTKHGIIFSSKNPLGTIAPNAKVNYSFNGRKGEYIILAKLFLNTQGSDLAFQVNGKTKVINTKTDNYNGFKWKKIGNFSLNNSTKAISVKNGFNGGLNVLDGIIVLPKEEFVKAKKVLVGYDKKATNIYTSDYIKAMFVQDILQRPNISLNGNKSRNLNIFGNNFGYNIDFENGDWQKESTYSQERELKKGEQKLSKLPTSKEWKITSDKFNGKLLGTGKNAGSYYLIYPLKSNIPFETLNINLKTLFLSSDKIAQLFISKDQENWIKLSADLTTDGNGYKIDATKYVKGLTKVYIKYEINDQNNAFGALLQSLGFNGSVKPIIRLEKQNNIFDLSNGRKHIIYGNPLKTENGKSNIGQKIIFKKNSPSSYSLKFNLKNPSVLMSKIAYSPYWRMGSHDPVVIDYYANGYLLSAGSYKSDLNHLPNTLYQFLLFLSFFCYLVIFLTLVWFVTKKNKI